MIVLDDRLAAAESMVRPGSRVADVGTDHGYLIARLLLSGKAVFGYACDIHPKPLEKARETLAQYGLLDRAKLCLGDGLQGLCSDQVDDIVIAGMGGDTILHILDEAGWHDPAQRFVLQPMTKAHELRSGLAARGYGLLQEQAALAKGFAYAVMQVQWTGVRRQISALEARVGLMAQCPSQAAQAYLANQAAVVRKMAEGMALSNTKRNESEKYYELYQEIQAICRDMGEKR